MTDLKARIGPKLDAQLPHANKVWVNPSKSSPRHTKYPDAPRENPISPPNSGLSLRDRLNIIPGTDKVNGNDSVSHAEERPPKSLLERVNGQPKKPSWTPQGSPRHREVNGRHCTPSLTLAENSSGDGRAAIKEQDIVASSHNGSMDTHKGARSHASLPLPHMNGTKANARSTPQSRESSIASSSRNTPRPSSNPLPTPPVSSTANQAPPSKIPSPTPRNNQPPTEDPLSQIRDKILPLVQKNASARGLAITIDRTAISDEELLAFAQRSSVVVSELQARGIATLPPKPTQMPDTPPASRSVDPVRRISKDYTNSDVPSGPSGSHSRHGSDADRRMATKSPEIAPSRVRHDSPETARRSIRSPPPPHWRESSTGTRLRSRAPHAYHQRKTSDDLRRYVHARSPPPPHHSRRPSTDNSSRPYSGSPSRNPRHSASPRRRPSFVSRQEYERSPDRYPLNRRDPGYRSSDERRRYDIGRGHPSAQAATPPPPSPPLDSRDRSYSLSTQSLNNDRRRDSIRSDRSPTRRNHERRSDSPLLRRRSASPERRNQPDRAMSEAIIRSSNGGLEAPHDAMDITPDALPAGEDIKTESPPPVEPANPVTDDQSGLMEEVHAEESMDEDEDDGDGPPGDPLPCHNVPGIWFAEFGKPTMSRKECRFQIDEYTAQKWGLGSSQPNIQSQDPKRGARKNKTKKKLSLRLCCMAKKQFEACVESVVQLPDSSPRQIASAIYALEKKWPPHGKLIINLNPDTPHKHSWLPHQITPDFVAIEAFVQAGENLVQLVQLSDLSDSVFVLYATDESESESDTRYPTPRTPSLSRDSVSRMEGAVVVTPL